MGACVVIATDNILKKLSPLFIILVYKKEHQPAQLMHK